MQYVSRNGENQKQMKEYTNSTISELIDEHIHSERDRKIMKRRLIDGITYEALAEETEMSVRQIKRIIYKNTNLITDYIT